MDDSMELLAPAGDEAALHAAVCAGADAVYLGYASFGARAAAANFDAEALERAVAYAHLHHVRVHVTVNTLVKPQELEAVYRVLATVAACRADAVIVQDLGVARMAREAFPTLALHASTQMALHSAAGARFALAHGFTRVVLARECTLPAIAAAAQTGVEVEVFVHGALCAGVSGQCLLSSMAGGRSGNRGRCAQPCRQTVTLGGTTAALLSTRDLCLRDHLPELRQAGVRSLKIEGRLKRPEYVAVVTQSYRRALDALESGDFRPADARERNTLLQIYNRGGFTVGHALGAEDADLCSTARVGHSGVPVGHIASCRNGLATVRLTAPLHDDDSLCVHSATDVELRYAGPEQTENATLRLRESEPVHAGDPVYRTADALQLRDAQALTEREIPITLRATVRVGEAMRVTASDGQSEGAAVGEPAQAAVSRALTREEIVRSLRKLGDTPFILRSEPESDTDGAFAAISTLNALRREAIEKLMEARRALFFGREKEARIAAMLAQADAEDAYTGFRTVGDGAVCESRSDHPNPTRDESAGKPAPRPIMPLMETLAVRFADASLGQEFLEAGANLLLYAPWDLRADVLARQLPDLPRGAWVAMPAQLGDEAFAQMLPVLETCADRLAGVVLGSVGQLGYRWPLPVALGEGVPLTNGEALRELMNPEIAFAVLWPELSGEDLTALHPADFPSLLGVYGRERVMLLNHCPLRVARGLAHGRADCALCGPQDSACGSPDAALTDRRGYCFPLTRVRLPEGCVIEVHNALPTDLSRQDSRRRALGAGMLLRFTVESTEEQLAVTRRFAALLRGESTPAADGQTTSGHFLRGVE